MLDDFLPPVKCTCGNYMSQTATICDECKKEAIRDLRHMLEDLTIEQIAYLSAEGYIGSAADELI